MNDTPRRIEPAAGAASDQGRRQFLDDEPLCRGQRPALLERPVGGRNLLEFHRFDVRPPLLGRTVRLRNRSTLVC
ncbi:hypothetical protein ACFQMM_03450 [Saliphagus sp. GCM10025308]